MCPQKRYLQVLPRFLPATLRAEPYQHSTPLFVCVCVWQHCSFTTHTLCLCSYHIQSLLPVVHCAESVIFYLSPSLCLSFSLSSLLLTAASLLRRQLWDPGCDLLGFDLDVEVFLLQIMWIALRCLAASFSSFVRSWGQLTHLEKKKTKKRKRNVKYFTTPNQHISRVVVSHPPGWSC